MGEKSYPPTCAGFTEVILMGLMVVVYSVIGGMKINLTGEGQSRRKEVFSQFLQKFVGKYGLHSLELPGTNTRNLKKYGKLPILFRLGQRWSSRQAESSVGPDEFQILRFSTVVQWNKWHLGSPGAQVRFPAQDSGLRIQGCCNCGLGSNCGSDLIPDLETLYTVGGGSWFTTSPTPPPKKRKYRGDLNCFGFFLLVVLSLD